MEPELAVVRAFSSHLEADLARSALESAGIESLIQGDDVGGQRAHVAFASGGFKLVVRQDDLESALEALGPESSPQ